MKEARVLALAGIFQALSLVRDLAREGDCDGDAMEASLASVFKLESDSAADVFGGHAGVRRGLRTLVEQVDGDGERDLPLFHMLISVLKLERNLARNHAVSRRLGEELAGMQRQLQHFPVNHPTILARLADIYAENLSGLKPRITVVGNPLYLRQPAQAQRVRALLLAAVRAAVLWHQLGGRRRHLLFRPQREVMIARGMLTGASLRG
ncbi:MAG TPA: high frequency lysogenization protein HflD [Rhodanobacteraceae bacterium]|nr:high frequency lysogenization protein HflD [Rhodanobacteraceae bacterium]